MNLRAGMFLALALFLGFALSFLGLGLMWVGLNPAAQLVSSLLFLLVTYFLTRATKANFPAFVAVGAGAFPIAAILVQFRDKNDSHLMPMMIVGGWFVGIAVGSWLAMRGSNTNKQ